MRIGIDARELLGRPTGVGRYLSGLLNEWSALRAPYEFRLYLPGAATGGPAGLPPAAAGSPSVSWRRAPGRGTTWWEQVQLPRAVARDDLDVFFSPGYTAPLALRIPMVVAIHDVSFAAHPQWFRWREGLRRRWLARAAARRAATVLTISEFSRGEIATHLGVERSRISVVPPGVTAAPIRPAARAATAPLVLFVGSLFNRRRLPDLIAAFGVLARAHPTVRLAMVGEDRTHPPIDFERAIAEHADHARDRIRMTSYVTDDELRTLYGEADVFAFLSEYEGFALTPMEALSAGVPLLLLDTPVAREVYGDAALYTDARAPEPVAAALARLLGEEPLRQRLREAAARTRARFTWPDAAARTLAVLERAARSEP